MSNHMIKICGVRHPELAVKIIEAGANYIGLVFHPTSSRYVDLDQATEIADAVKKAGGETVAIFCDHKDREMQIICDVTKIEIIQLHGAHSRAHHSLLPEHYRRIYVLNRIENEVLRNDEGIQYLDHDRDMILIDHEQPGQGKLINREGFNYTLQFPWMLAGGLTSHNVASLIGDLKPNGVDVSSGVERIHGEKDLFLIHEFIHSVRGAYAR